MFDLTLRPPNTEDGPGLHRLVQRCPPLDENSRYCNLLQVSHFRDTAIVAERDGELIGFVTGYRIPGRAHVLFVWQVAVAPEGRGQRLAPRMIDALLARQQGVTHLETTVTPDNAASSRVFERVAEDLNAPLNRTTHFHRDRHFDGVHDDEVLFSIGPFEVQSARRAHPGNESLKETGT